MICYCGDSGSKWVTTEQTEQWKRMEMLRPFFFQSRAGGSKWIRLGLQTNHYCAYSGSKLSTTTQTRALYESEPCRLGIQINHYHAISGSKWIITTQTRATNESLLSSWKGMDFVHVLFFQFMGGVHVLFLPLCAEWMGLRRGLSGAIIHRTLAFRRRMPPQHSSTTPSPIRDCQTHSHMTWHTHTQTHICLQASVSVTCFGNSVDGKWSVISG